MQEIRDIYQFINVKLTNVLDLWVWEGVGKIRLILESATPC